MARRENFRNIKHISTGCYGIKFLVMVFYMKKLVTN